MHDAQPADAAVLRRRDHEHAHAGQRRAQRGQQRRPVRVEDADVGVVVIRDDVALAVRAEQGPEVEPVAAAQGVERRRDRHDEVAQAAVAQRLVALEEALDAVVDRQARHDGDAGGVHGRLRALLLLLLLLLLCRGALAAVVLLALALLVLLLCVRVLLLLVLADAAQARQEAEALAGVVAAGERRRGGGGRRVAPLLRQRSAAAAPLRRRRRRRRRRMQRRLGVHCRAKRGRHLLLLLLEPLDDAVHDAPLHTIACAGWNDAGL